jgi:thioredoxin 1
MLFITQESEISSPIAIKSLYFYASWMPYHKKMMVMIDKMEQKYKEIEFLAIDVDYFKGLCKRFNIESIPTILIINKGEELKRINGLIMTSALKSAFADICNS